MGITTTFRGLSTISFWASDLAVAKQWYTELFGVEPYFERPGYFEFRLGDFQHELGVIDSRYAPNRLATSPSGAIVYWHVDDVTAIFDKLLTMGATKYEEPIERGPGFITASVVDPFGNIRGIMYNAHFLEVVESTKKP
ncbi:glyoxalase [Brevibacillus reuszeri]|uniref:Glyoxalase n=1 Tax=Brevibacillus reuszeri TaxID=54915 RepID=A0A0K9YW08_9BACL|nr:VOC family protein [Brevibacillus reuszeri]KNB72832.1 glyoxalase [Brevibacillus reuszeri]MED1860458.1 VOC family protein [Brevibacillus reuszeri]GED70127.1 glyoxalase [Brevibacillus reuszeri]